MNQMNNECNLTLKFMDHECIVNFKSMNETWMNQVKTWTIKPWIKWGITQVTMRTHDQ